MSFMKHRNGKLWKILRWVRFCAWLQGGKDMAEWQYGSYGDIWLINNIPKGRTNTGRIFEVDDFKQNDAYCIKDKLSCPTILYDEDGNITDGRGKRYIGA